MRKFRKFLLLFSISFTLSLLASYAWYSNRPPRNTLKVTTHIEYYDIHGNTPMELTAAMKKEAATSNDGHKYFGVTNWNLNYRTTLAEIDGLHFIDKADIALDIIYHLPNRITSEGEDLYAQEWNRFYAALYDHEKVHATIAETHAKELYDAFLSRKDFSNKEEVRLFRIQTADKYFEKIRANNRQYDKETNHGETQGARLRSL